MLLFTLYNTFTLETNDFRLDFKELTFFPGWRLAIPILTSLLLTIVHPVASIGVFLLAFILELGASIYKRIPKNDRPSIQELATACIAAIIACMLGIVVFHFFPRDLYFIIVGLAILALTAFAWYAGSHRSAFRSSWGIVWGATHIALGACGVEISSYAKGVLRNFSSPIDKLLGLTTMMAAFIGTLALFISHNDFSLPSLVAAVGCAFGIRIAGTYEFTKTGKFSYLATGLAILIVLCLYLVSPTPTGLPEILTNPM